MGFYAKNYVNYTALPKKSKMKPAQRKRLRIKTTEKRNRGIAVEKGYMTNGIVNYESDYSPVGAIVVLSLCIVIFLLMRAAFITKSRNFTLFQIMVLLVAAAAVLEITTHMLYHAEQASPTWIYISRSLYFTCLFSNLYVYVLYIINILWLDKKTAVRYVAVSCIGLVFILIYLWLGSFLKFGFYIEPDGSLHTGFNAFIPAYLFYVAILFFGMLHYRDRIVKQILIGVLSTAAVAFLLLGIQGILHRSSYTTVAFILPLLALFYLAHSNPYDMDTGAIDESSFENLIIDYYKNGKTAFLMSLHLRDFDHFGKIPKEISGTIRHFVTSYLKGAVLFRVSNGRLVLVFPLAKNPDYLDTVQIMIQHFEEVYPKFRLDYRIVLGETVDSISRDADYINLIQFVEKNMENNSVFSYDENDIKQYLDQTFILKQMEDIARKGNLEDPRVLVYCQPVYNIVRKQYDTAEALMRLKLDKLGLVFPDRFIPLAEENHLIHALSLIILNKTCKMIRGLSDMGYDIKRISVNFSVSELYGKEFCQEIREIVEKNGIPEGTLAIELTESTTDSDFLIMKAKINELKESGIMFYLDDFGTGYSNFERILELPFDIIKFDRSLVIASNKNDRSERMVYALANMFANMDYSVLYEGVEDETDEDRCIHMCAHYLQGYKYSKPIPIEQLTDFFMKKTVEQAASVQLEKAE